jgi:hypothetical protein
VQSSSEQQLSDSGEQEGETLLAQRGAAAIAAAAKSRKS